MNVFAKFDEIPSMILQDIMETKRYGHTVGRSDNVKTVYPPTNTVCGGYNNATSHFKAWVTSNRRLVIGLEGIDRLQGALVQSYKPTRSK